ncbi:NERD domain-containing protein [Candidatus Parcubacteria bacterium]|nr:MAG: NERD domain-containing protein [Candidatus Parcubacteria bacterium]
MIVKEREKSLYLIKLEKVIARMTEENLKYPLVYKEFMNHQAGYRGEQAVDYYLTFLPKKEYLIFNGIRLEDSLKRFFQIDTLVVTPWYILILEIKNIIGDLEFDYKQNQLIRTNDDKLDRMACPITQAKRQRAQLHDWLTQHNFQNIPIEYQVVIENNHARIINADRYVYEKVSRHSNIPHIAGSFEEKYSEVIFTEKELKKLSKLILKKDTPNLSSPLTQLQIDVSELAKGVQCPHCNTLNMKRLFKVWFCTTCQFSSTTAHITALQDYALLVSDTISNKELRDFLQLDSISVATKILTALQLPTMGAKRNRRYLLIKNNKLLI